MSPSDLPVETTGECSGDSAPPRRTLLAGIGGFAAGALLAGARTAQAGPLTPPAGPIASTGKTIGEVEPRIAVNATNTPGDATVVFRIVQAGSYYLTGNIIAPAGRAYVIEILASGVTLDLGGFLISGAGTAQSAVRVTPIVQGVQIRNGSIAGCTSHGITSGAPLTIIEDVNVGTCTGNGFDLGQLAQVRRCTARSNNTHGIRVGPNSVIAECVVTANSMNGIEALPGSVVRDCVSEGNAVGIQFYSNCSASNCRVRGSAASSIGFQAFSGETGVTLTDCHATGAGRGFWFQGGRMTLSRCSASGLTGSQTAFEIGPSSILSDCRAEHNSGVGFLLFARPHVTNCTAIQNAGDGFRANSSNAGTFINCTAVNNTANGFDVADGFSVQGCIANDNLQNGIAALNGCSILNCTTRNNQGNGIAVNFSCLVRGNSCNGDGTGIAFEAGISVSGQANRVEGNNITFADRGLKVTSGGNVIVTNSLRGCTVNFDIVGGNDVGPIGSAASATSPWANIQY